MLLSLYDRVRDGLGWRIDLARQRGGPRFAECEATARHVFWSLPGLGPKSWDHVTIARHSGLGDVLMCTPALRVLKRVNPHVRVTFFTCYPGLVRGLPFIDEVRGDVSECPPGAIRLRYEHALPPRRHIARIMGDWLGVRVTDVRPSCVARPDLLEHYRAKWREFRRPVIVVNRTASAHTPNKEWPGAYWDETVASLARTYAVAEIGAKPTDRPVTPPGCYLDLRGKTDLDGLVAAVATADLHVGPISGPVHIAAAFRIPAVVIYGGYEHPVCSAYPGNVNLYSAEPCSPCWLTEPCSFGRICLSRITPDTVVGSVHKILRGPADRPVRSRVPLAIR